MRIASGTTDQVIFFVAVDSTDYVTRETGLSSFTVYRARETGAATAMTTPTVTELSSGNMPGVYKLLLDEDMTIGSGNDTEEMVFHITHAGMAPVTRTIELYRPKITVGNTLDVTSTGAAGIDWANVENQSTSVNLSSTTTNLVNTATTVTNQVTAAAMADAVWLEAIADHSGTGGSTAEALAGAGGAPSAASIADAVWLETLADHSGSSGSTAEALNSAASAGDPWSTALPGAYGAGTAGKIVGDNINAPIATVDTVVDGIATSVAALNDLSAAEVNAEVLDVLNVDTFSEPGQGTPTATPTIRQMLHYMYKFWRNKKDNDGSETKLYADDGSTIDQKQTTTDSAGITSLDEWTTGP